eukprot:g5352.t1
MESRSGAPQIRFHRSGSISVQRPGSSAKPPRYRRALRETEEATAPPLNDSVHANASTVSATDFLDAYLSEHEHAREHPRDIWERSYVRASQRTQFKSLPKRPRANFRDHMEPGDSTASGHAGVAAAEVELPQRLEVERRSLLEEGQYIVRQSVRDAFRMDDDLLAEEIIEDDIEPDVDDSEIASKRANLFLEDDDDEGLENILEDDSDDDVIAVLSANRSSGRLSSSSRAPHQSKDTGTLQEALRRLYDNFSSGLQLGAIQNNSNASLMLHSPKRKATPAYSSAALPRSMQLASDTTAGSGSKRVRFPKSANHMSSDVLMNISNPSANARISSSPTRSPDRKRSRRQDYSEESENDQHQIHRHTIVESAGVSESISVSRSDPARKQQRALKKKERKRRKKERKKRRKEKKRRKKERRRLKSKRFDGSTTTLTSSSSMSSSSSSTSSDSFSESDADTSSSKSISYTLPAPRGRASNEKRHNRVEEGVMQVDTGSPHKHCNNQIPLAPIPLPANLKELD